MIDSLSLPRLSAVRSRRAAPLRALVLLCLALAWLLSSMPARADEDFLPPDQAFAFSSKEVPGAIEIHYRIADGYYMYRERFDVALAPGATASLGTPTLPVGQIKFDPTFNKDVEVYHHEVTLHVPVSAAQGPFTVRVTGQGCAEKGVCYPPMTHTVRIAGAALGQAAAPARDEAAADTRGSAADRLHDPAYAQSVLSGRSVPATIGIFFLLGLGMSLLPCSWPMIPIVSSLVVGSGAGPGRLRGLALSFSYVLGMSAVYTALGVLAGYAGQGLGAALQNPWMLGAFGILLALFGLAQLGCFTLQMPHAWQSRMSNAAGQQQAGRLPAVFVMGALSALVVGACMTAPLFGVLTFIAQTGRAALGAVALFAMALGLGVPLLVIGVGAGALLPRAGNWMNMVKHAFGVLLLGAAWWIASPAMPSVLALGLLAAWLALMALGLWRTHHLPWAWLARAVALPLGAYALCLVAGAAAGARDVTQPLAPFVPRADAAASPPGEQAATRPASGAQIRSEAELTRALTGLPRPAMLVFHADWCTSCLEMEREVFPAPAVSAAMRGFAVLHADVTRNTPDDQALLKRFGLFGPPAIVFFDAQGKELRAHRVVGFQDAARFLSTLQAVQADGAAARQAAASPAAASDADARTAAASADGLSKAARRGPQSASGAGALGELLAGARQQPSSSMEAPRFGLHAGSER